MTPLPFPFRPPARTFAVLRVLGPDEVATEQYVIARAILDSIEGLRQQLDHFSKLALHRIECLEVELQAILK